MMLRMTGMIKMMIGKERDGGRKGDIWREREIEREAQRNRGRGIGGAQGNKEGKEQEMREMWKGK